MLHRVLAGLFVVVAIVVAQRPSEKPSPVPQRPVRPQYTATAATKPKPPGEAERARVSDRDAGSACFFSSTANGAVTVSGARLDSEQLMAAHPWFPMGSTVKVRNRANGKTVDVRIVDRFPGGSGRVINVSEAAARELGFVKAGTAQVELNLVTADTDR